MLLRFTSSSSLSLFRTLFSISSMFVGFGGSSGTGLYLSGCTTPGGEGRKETPTCPPRSLPHWFSYYLCTMSSPGVPFHPLLPFLRPRDPLPTALGTLLSNILTANAFGVADFSAADGVVVLLVAHQCVHAQNCWRELGGGGGRQGMRRRGSF